MMTVIIIVYTGTSIIHVVYVIFIINSFNVDTLNWRELSPTTSHDGPMMKSFCGMTVLQINDEDYLAVVGGSRKSSSNTPKQPGAQYKGDLDGFFKCSEIHLYQVSSCQYIFVNFILIIMIIQVNGSPQLLLATDYLLLIVSV